VAERTHGVAGGQIMIFVQGRPPAVLPENVWCPECRTCFPVAQLFRERQWVWDGWCLNCGFDARAEYQRAASWAAAQATRLGKQKTMSVQATMDGFIMSGSCDAWPFRDTGTCPGDRFEAVETEGLMQFLRLPPVVSK
jgi:hypothetical protein